MSKWKVGDLVWVKMASYPWWPAEIVDENDKAVTEEVLEAKKDGAILVRFFYEHNFSWMPKNSKSMQPFRCKSYKRYAESKSSSIKKALKEALDTEKENGGPPPEDSDKETNDEENTEKVDKVQPAKPKRGRPPKSTSEDPKKRGRGRPPKKLKKTSDDDETEKKTKRKRGRPAKTEKKKRVRKDKKTDKQEKVEKQDDEDEEEGEPFRKRRRLRRKQDDDEMVLTSDDKENEIKKQLKRIQNRLKTGMERKDKGIISRNLKKLKDLELTIALVHTTGVGKTVSKLTKSTDSNISNLALEVKQKFIEIMDQAIQTGEINDLSIGKKQNTSAEKDEEQNNEELQNNEEEPQQTNEEQQNNENTETTKESTETVEPMEENNENTENWNGQSG
eukprot:TRINITY_DN918_c0_g1_i2.p1 TRINITY_DN918_c0_g1~~TRINITY_DN918_c0_g1_i2.p1  ORF type:complete len:390 (+),score=113.10 TRINITY_DN918_c0_g1_i2:52-1221(+)